MGIITYKNMFLLEQYRRKHYKKRTLLKWLTYPIKREQYQKEQKYEELFF